jgi:glycosyltransferase involved in cell wall biosynthesis
LSRQGVAPIRMKVAYILPSLQKATGWRSHAIAFLGAIAAYVSPLLLVSVDDAAEAQRLFPQWPIFSLPATQAASMGNIHGLRLLLDTRRALGRLRLPEVDLVHSLEAYPTGLVGDWLARRIQRPHILTIHGTYGVIWHEVFPDRFIYSGVLQRAGLVCPVSQGTARQMIEHFGRLLPADKILPILNGNDFYQRVARQQALERLPPDVPTLLTVGDIKPRKGQHVSLAAFARLKARLPEARYYLAGRYENNAYFQQLQQFVAGQKLADVHFMGAVPTETLQKLYQQASVFVLAAQQIGLHFEGFGLVYLEAGAYGLPVIATRSGGVMDAVKEGETGLLVEPQDVDGLADAMLRLLTDASLAQRLGQANRLWAETLTWERNAAAYAGAYQNVLAKAEQT